MSNDSETETFTDTITSDNEVPIINDDSSKIIASLESDKSLLIEENQGHRSRISDLISEIEDLKRNHSSNIADFINKSEEVKRNLLMVTSRAQELETELFRLQHEMGTLTNENADNVGEISKLRDDIDMLKEEKVKVAALGIEKVHVLEHEKVLLLEKVEEKERENESLKAEIEKLNDVKEMMEMKVTGLQGELDEAELKRLSVAKVVNGGEVTRSVDMEEMKKSSRTKGLKKNMLIVDVSLTKGTAAALGGVFAVGALGLIIYARRR